MTTFSIAVFFLLFSPCLAIVRRETSGPAQNFNISRPATESTSAAATTSLTTNSGSGDACILTTTQYSVTEHEQSTITSSTETTVTVAEQTITSVESTILMSTEIVFTTVTVTPPPTTVFSTRTLTISRLSGAPISSTSERSGSTSNLLIPNLRVPPDPSSTTISFARSPILSTGGPLVTPSSNPRPPVVKRSDDQAPICPDECGGSCETITIAGTLKQSDMPTTIFSMTKTSTESAGKTTEVQTKTSVQVTKKVSAETVSLPPVTFTATKDVLVEEPSAAPGGQFRQPPGESTEKNPPTEPDPDPPARQNPDPPKNQNPDPPGRQNPGPPDRPNSPQNPDNPQNPSRPQNLNDPQHPNNPQDPNTPSNPNDPQQPNNPPNPGNPQRPDSSQNQNSPPNPNNPQNTNGSPQDPANRPSNEQQQQNPGFVPGPVATIDGEVVRANPSSAIVVGGSTLIPGGPAITASGSVMSIGPSGNELIVAPIPATGRNAPPAAPARTFQISPAPAPAVTGGPAPAPVIATVGDVPVTLAQGASSLVLGPGTTLFPGSSGVVLPGGTPVSLAAPTGQNGAPVLIYGSGSNAQSITVPPAAAAGRGSPGTQSFPTPLVIPGGPNSAPLTIAPGASSVVIAPGTTLTPGSSPVTLSNGQVVSLSPAASSGGSPVLVYGTGNAASRITLPPSAATVVGAFVPFAITDGPGDKPFTIAPNSPLVIDGKTLVAGGPARTIDGTVVSLASGSSYLVVGSSTVPIGAIAAAQQQQQTAGLSSSSLLSGYGSLIWKGIGGNESSTTTTSTATTGISDSKKPQSSSDSDSDSEKTKSVSVTTTTLRVTETVARSSSTGAAAAGVVRVQDWKVLFAVAGGAIVVG